MISYNFSILNLNLIHSPDARKKPVIIHELILFHIAFPCSSAPPPPPPPLAATTTTVIV